MGGLQGVVFISNFLLFSFKYVRYLMANWVFLDFLSP